MKSSMIAAEPIYTFLSYCNDSPLEKEVLDCGAGGRCPPLALFFEHGYKTHGIDISSEQIESAQEFCRQHHMDLGIRQADMRELPFDNESMSFVYSHDSICHMTKADVGVVLNEMHRVLRKDGLGYVNFLSVEEGRFGEGELQGPGEYIAEIDGEMCLHCFFEDTEPEAYLRRFKLLRKEKRRVETFSEKGPYICADLGYVTQKE